MDDPRGGAPAAAPGASSFAVAVGDDCAGHGRGARAEVSLGGPPCADASDLRDVAAAPIASGFYEPAARGQTGGSEGFGPRAPFLGRVALPLPEPGAAPTEAAGAARPGFFTRPHPSSARLVSQPLSQSTPGFVLAYAPVHPAPQASGFPPRRPAGSVSADSGLAGSSGGSAGRAAAAPSGRGDPSGNARGEWCRVPQDQRHQGGFARADEAGSVLGFGDGTWVSTAAPARVSDRQPAPLEGRGLPSPYVAGATPFLPSDVSEQVAPGAGWGAPPQRWPTLQQSLQGRPSPLHPSPLQQRPSSQHPSPLQQRPSTQIPLQLQHSSSLSQVACFPQSPTEDFASGSWSLPPPGAPPGLLASPHLPPLTSAQCETPQRPSRDGCAFSDPPRSAQAAFADAHAAAVFGAAGGPSPESRVRVVEARMREDGRVDRLGALGPPEFAAGPSGHFLAAPAAFGVPHPSQGAPAPSGERDGERDGERRFESPQATPQLAVAPAWPCQPCSRQGGAFPDPFVCAPSEASRHPPLAPVLRPHAPFSDPGREGHALGERRSFAATTLSLEMQPHLPAPVRDAPFAFLSLQPSAGTDVGDAPVDRDHGAGAALYRRDTSSDRPVFAPARTPGVGGSSNALAGAAAARRTDGFGELASTGAGEAGGVPRGEGPAAAYAVGAPPVTETPASQRCAYEATPAALASRQEAAAAAPLPRLSTPPTAPATRPSAPPTAPASTPVSAPSEIPSPRRRDRNSLAALFAGAFADRFGVPPASRAVEPSSASTKSASSRPSIASAPARRTGAFGPPAPPADPLDPTSPPSASAGAASCGGSEASLEEQRKARAREYNRLAQARFRANLREKRRKAAEEDEATRRALDLARAEHAALIAQRDLLERLLVFRDDCAKVLAVAAELAEEGGGPRFGGRGNGAFWGDGRHGTSEGELGGVVQRWMGTAGRFAGSARGSWLDASSGGWSNGAATWGDLPTTYLVPEEHGVATDAGRGPGSLDGAPWSSRGWEGGLDWAGTLVGMPGAPRETVLDTPSKATQRAALDASPAVGRNPIPDASPAAAHNAVPDAASAGTASGGVAGRRVLALRPCAPPEIHDTASPTSSTPAPPVHALFKAVRKLQLPELRGLTPGQRAWFDAVFFMISENEFAIPADEELAQADVESLAWHFQLLGLQFARERRLMVLGENGSIGVEATDASRPDGGSTTLDVVASKHAPKFVAQVVGKWVMVDDEEERRKKKRPGKGSQGSSAGSATGSGSRAGTRPGAAAAAKVTSPPGAGKGALAAARWPTSASFAPREPQTAQFSHHQPERRLQPPTAATGDDEAAPGARASGDHRALPDDSVSFATATGPDGVASDPFGGLSARALSGAVAADAGRTLADASTPDAAESVRSRPSSDAPTQHAEGSVRSQCSRGLPRGSRSTSPSRASAASAEASPSSSLVSPPSTGSGQDQSAPSSHSMTWSSKGVPARSGRATAFGGQPSRAPTVRSRPSSRPVPDPRLSCADRSSAPPTSPSDAAAKPGSPTGPSSPFLSSPRSPPEEALPMPLPLNLAMPSLNPDIVTPLMSDMTADDASAHDSGSVLYSHPDSAASGTTSEAATGSGDADVVSGPLATPNPLSDPAASPRAASAPRSPESVLSTPLPVLGALGPEGLERILRETPELQGIAEILFSDGHGPAPLRELLSALSAGMFKNMTLRDLISTDPGLLVSLGVGGASGGDAGAGRGASALAAMLGERGRGAAPEGGSGGQADTWGATLGSLRPGAARPGDASAAALFPPMPRSPPPSVAPAPVASSSSRPAAVARGVSVWHSPSKSPDDPAPLASLAQAPAAPASLASSSWAPADPTWALSSALGLSAPAPVARPVGSDAPVPALRMEAQDPEETLHNEYLVGRSMALMALSRQGEGLSLEPAAARPDVGAEWSPLAREARAQVLRLMRTLLERRPEDVVPVFRGEPEDVAAAESDPEHWRRAVRGIGLRPLQKVAIADLAVRVRLALESIMRRRKRALEALLRVLKDERLPNIQTGAARSARAFALLGLCRDTLSDERAVWMHVYARVHRIADSRQMLVLRMLAWPCHTDLGRLLDVVFEDVARERVISRERLAARRRSKARAARAAEGAVVGATTLVEADPFAEAVATAAAAACGSAAPHAPTRGGKRRSFEEGIRRAFEADGGR